MILGTDKAKVGNSARGETFKSSAYSVEIDRKSYILHDTAGFGEHSSGTVDSAKVVVNLYRLVTDLSKSGGVNLLVFVVKCGRLTEATDTNYKLFHRGFCDSNVLIVIVVTGCEDVEPMNMWWTDNEQSFTEAEMLFNGHACVCAYKGRKRNHGGYRNEDLVEQSEEVVKQLVVQCCTSNGWKKVCQSQPLVPRLNPQNSPKHLQSNHHLIGLKRLSYS